MYPWLRATGLLALATLAAGLVFAAEEALDLSGWDWSGVEETKPQVTHRKSRTLDPNKPRVGETAKPDLDRPPLPAQAGELFAAAPDFKVVPSQKDPDMHPCRDCHGWAKSDYTPRPLKEPHDNFVLEHGLHGKGKFWCFTCHHLEDDGGLVTLEEEKVGFDHAYLMCGQCHADEARDWVYGAHGKRMGNWQGERRVLNCTACHYQHRPELKPRQPMAGPRVRMGLEDMDFGHGEDGTMPAHRPHWSWIEGDHQAATAD